MTATTTTSGLLFVVVSLLLPLPVPAPVPRCSPFIIINKLAEHSSIWSDSNPYFPVPPCEYGGPLEALAAGDPKSVFVLAQPQKVPLHNFYEFIWLLKTGIPRMARIIAGTEKAVTDPNILSEGYQHYTPYERTKQIGHGTRHRPEIIDDFNIYRRVVGGKIGSLIRSGPDRRPTAYTPQGPLRRKATFSPHSHSHSLPSSSRSIAPHSTRLKRKRTQSKEGQSNRSRPYSRQSVSSLPSWDDWEHTTLQNLPLRASQY